MNDKQILVEYLYLDLETCERCIGNDKVLAEVLKELAPAFEIAGYDIIYKQIEIESSDLAEKYKFMSSPTIRVNGKDICGNINETDCGCCGNICGTEVDCRIFEYEGSQYEVAPKAMLAEGILKNAFIKEDDDADYYMPENLIKFFKGKQEKSTCCSCGCSCC